MDERLVVKCCVAVFLGIVRFCVVYVPVRIFNVIHGEDEERAHDFLSLSKQKRYNFYMAAIHSFGAGVMLCTCIVHLVTSVHTAIAHLDEGADGSTMKVSTCQDSQVLICAGFFMIYFIEQTGQWIITQVPSKPSRKQVEVRKKVSRVGNTVINSITENMQKCQKSKPIEIVEKQNSEEELSSEETSEFVIVDRKQFVRFIFTEVAVGVHAFFEGLAIGIQCEVSNVIYLTIGLSIHSITALLCLGFNFIISRSSKKAIVSHFAVLAITSPLGVITGMLIYMGDLKFEEQLRINVYMEALSAGNIMYITFFDILSKEKKKSWHKLWRNTFMLAGFGLMVFLEYFPIMDFKSFYTLENV